MVGSCNFSHFSTTGGFSFHFDVMVWLVWVFLAAGWFSDVHLSRMRRDEIDWRQFV